MYASMAPRQSDWPTLLTKMGALINQDYDWSMEVAAIKAPTLLVYGDADAVRTSHAVQFFELLGGGKKDGGWDGSGISNSRLSILPGLTHYTVFSSPLLASTVTSFLDAPARSKRGMKAGYLLASEGCMPKAMGARVRLSDGKMTVSDGPFTEAKEVIRGFAILRANSKAEAVELAKQFLQVVGEKSKSCDSTQNRLGRAAS